MDLGLSRRRALVVGASRGLGAAVARRLAMEGADVIAAARSTDVTEKWIAGLPPDVAGRITPVRLDLGDTATLDTAADQALGAGPIDILVNNCGGPPPGAARDMGDEAWLEAFRSMALATFHLTRRLLPGMIERRWGRVVTIGSSGIVQPIANLALSNAVRASIAAWSKTLSGEVGAAGVTVNMVLPGRIDTERVASLDAARAKRESLDVGEVRRRSMAEIPVGRYGEADEFAAVVAFLASAPASYVTGSMVRVDGGLMRSV